MMIGSASLPHGEVSSTIASAACALVFSRATSLMSFPAGSLARNTRAPLAVNCGANSIAASLPASSLS